MLNEAGRFLLTRRHTERGIPASMRQGVYFGYAHSVYDNPWYLFSHLFFSYFLYRFRQFGFSFFSSPSSLPSSHSTENRISSFFFLILEFIRFYCLIIFDALVWRRLENAAGPWCGGNGDGDQFEYKMHEVTSEQIVFVS